MQRPPAALVLRSPFTSLADVGVVHYPWLPVRRLLIDRYPSIERIASVSAPVLVIAGDRDDVVPASLSKQLLRRGRRTEAVSCWYPGSDTTTPSCSTAAR